MKKSKVVLIVGAVVLFLAIVTSPSYFLVQRENGMTFKIKHQATHSPLIKHEKDTSEVVSRVLVVGGLTVLIFWHFKKKERG